MVRDPGSIVRYSEQCYNSVVFDDLNPLLLATARAAIGSSEQREASIPTPSWDNGYEPPNCLRHLLYCIIIC
jgi:hypothetical protein